MSHHNFAPTATAELLLQESGSLSDEVDSAILEGLSGRRAPLSKYLGAAVVVFNLIVGSGVLAVPRAFYLAGWALGIAVLSVMGFFAFCSIVWLYECQLRAQALNAAFVAGVIRVVPFGKNTGLEFDGLLDDTTSSSAADDGDDDHKAGHESPKPTPRAAADDLAARPRSTSIEKHHTGRGKQRVALVLPPPTADPSNADDAAFVGGSLITPQTGGQPQFGASLPEEFNLDATPCASPERAAKPRSASPPDFMVAMPPPPHAAPHAQSPRQPTPDSGGGLPMGTTCGLRQLGYGICMMPARTPVVVDGEHRHHTPQAHPASVIPPGLPPIDLDAPHHHRASPGTPGRLSDRTQSNLSSGEGKRGMRHVAVLNGSMTELACPAVVYDPSHAGDTRVNAPETTTPFVLAVKAQQGTTWLGLYDVEPAASVEDINDTVNYHSLDHSVDYLEQDYVATVCGGRPVAFLGNLAQSMLLFAGTWVYLVVIGRTAVLTVPIAGYTSFLECNIHEEHAFYSHPHCSGAMRAYIAIFTLVFLIATARNWRIIDIFQRMATVVTYVALAIMVASCAYGMTQQPFDHTVSQTRVQAVPAFNGAHFSDLFGVVAFCLVCHPGSALMLRRMPHRGHVVRVYAASFGSVFVLYATVSIVVAFYMGTCVSSVMNLNWINFGDTWGKVDSTPLRVLGIIVVMFPIFSVGACCVLYLRALAESVEAYMPAAWLTKLAALLGHEYEGAGVTIYPIGSIIRALVVLLPATCALISFEFGKAMAVAGFFAFFIVFFVPGVMQLYSKRIMDKVGLRPSPRETVFGHTVIVVAVLVLTSAAAVFYVVDQMIPALE